MNHTSQSAQYLLTFETSANTFGNIAFESQLLISIIYMILMAAFPVQVPAQTWYTEGHTAAVVLPNSMVRPFRNDSGSGLQKWLKPNASHSTGKVQSMPWLPLRCEYHGSLAENFSCCDSIIMGSGKMIFYQHSQASGC